jgi:tRNA pseudouridine13 synthase
MKLRQRPEDFEVEELTSIAASGGPYAFYRLEKRGWTTHDALAAVRRRWKLEHRRLAYGGLKDRHAHTIQYLTILRGPQRKLTQQGFTVTYLGQVAEPYSSTCIQANRFRLTLRALGKNEIGQALQALAEVQREGVPNYFDDQRFGSVLGHGGFVARSMVVGRYEEALKQALAAHYEHDRADRKAEKALLRSHWGDWRTLKDQLPRGHARSLVDYLLVHPDDFRGALVRLRPELRGLYLSAYQSYLWNRMLARWLREHVQAEQLLNLRLALGEVPVHRGLDDAQRAELSAVSLPLPSARLTLPVEDPRVALMDAVLAEEGISRELLKLKAFKELFFSKGERAALCLPAGLQHEAGEDELNPGKQKLVLSFELPRGCYATLIVKRITQKATT